VYNFSFEGEPASNVGGFPTFWQAWQLRKTFTMKVATPNAYQKVEELSALSVAYPQNPNLCALTFSFILVF
jgi:hypothetical protein